MDIAEEIRGLLDDGGSTYDISEELGLDLEDVVDIYEDWKQRKMDAISLGDKVCYVLNLEGYKEQLVYGDVIIKLTNSVIVLSEEDEYIVTELNSRVAVSIKDILKVN